MKQCEHCGSAVKVTPVCAKCTRDHSAEWLAEGLKEDRKFSLFWQYYILVAQPLLIGISIWLDLDTSTILWGAIGALVMSIVVSEHAKT